MKTENEPTTTADAITELGEKIAYGAGTDANGGHIECLSSAVMGITAGLCRIAEEHERLATAVEQLADILAEQQRCDPAE